MKGGVTPTARKARTGLSTPPGRKRWASANSYRERLEFIGDSLVTFQPAGNIISVKGDNIILLNGLEDSVMGYSTDGDVECAESGFNNESELEPWDPVTAVQRYAASFGMKVNVDVS